MACAKRFLFRNCKFLFKRYKAGENRPFYLPAVPKHERLKKLTHIRNKKQCRINKILVEEKGLLADAKARKAALLDKFDQLKSNRPSNPLA